MGDDKLPSAAREYFREQGRIGGLQGGKARAKKLSPAQRKEIARKAGLASAAARAKARKKKAVSKSKE